MKKSKEQLQAEQIFATMLRNNDGDPKKVLAKAISYANDFKFSIAQRTTTTVFLATLYDMWEDFTEEDVKRTYEEYEKYYDSFRKGNENIFKQMLAIDDMLDKQLLSGKLFDVIEDKANDD